MLRLCAIPDDIFRNKAEYNRVDEFFESLPKRTAGHLSPLILAQQNVSRSRCYVPQSPNSEPYILDAEKGLFSFDEESMPTPIVYKLSAAPLEPLTLRDIPPDIAGFVGRFLIPDIFSLETGEIDVRKWFTSTPDYKS